MKNNLTLPLKIMDEYIVIFNGEVKENIIKKIFYPNDEYPLIPLNLCLQKNGIFYENELSHFINVGGMNICQRDIDRQPLIKKILDLNFGCTYKCCGALLFESQSKIYCLKSVLMQFLDSRFDIIKTPKTNFIFPKIEKICPVTFLNNQTQTFNKSQLKKLKSHLLTDQNYENVYLEISLENFNNLLDCVEGKNSVTSKICDDLKYLNSELYRKFVLQLIPVFFDDLVKKIIE